MKKLLPLLLLLAACGGDGGPRLSAWQDGAWVPLELTSNSIDGQRDGATTTANILLHPGEGEALELRLEIRYDPTPVLGVGSWSRGSESGQVRAESVEFAGGQGEGPSVGGVFVMEQDGASRYRVKLPLRPVVSKTWQVE